MRFNPLLVLGLAFAGPLLLAQNEAARDASAANPAVQGALATDPTYRLNLGDRIGVSLFGEGDLSAQQMIDRNGLVRLPLIGEVSVAGRTVREAEKLIESTYKKEEILKAPQATLTMVAYAPREVTLLGAVRAPGTFQFPPDTVSLDIRDVIARQGGFTPVAKGDSVAVTRRQPSGKEETVVINVDRMMFGRSRKRENDEVYMIYPGDRIYVPERLF
jgi:polysaccharide export outer membrane protein